MNDDWRNRYELAIEAARQAGDLARAYYETTFDIETKADSSPVTEADQQIETEARALVRARHPELGILGEEQGEAPGSVEARLIIDPIDGTRNFVRGIPVFGTLLAVEVRGEVVAGVVSAPALRMRWLAARGSGAFRDGRRLAVSRVSALREATLFHGNLGSGEAGPPRGILQLIGDGPSQRKGCYRKREVASEHEDAPVQLKMELLRCHEVSQ